MAAETVQQLADHGFLVAGAGDDGKAAGLAGKNGFFRGVRPFADEPLFLSGKKAKQVDDSLPEKDRNAQQGDESRRIHQDIRQICRNVHAI